jgi:hypothetical protein
MFVFMRELLFEILKFISVTSKNQKLKTFGYQYQASAVEFQCHESN